MGKPGALGEYLTYYERLYGAKTDGASICDEDLQGPLTH